MIEYEPGRWSVWFAFSLKGSIFPKSFVFAAPCGVLACGLHVLFHSTPQAMLILGAGDIGTSVLGGFTFVLGFLVVFRSQQAYARWWEGGTLLQLILIISRGGAMSSMDGLIRELQPSAKRPALSFADALAALVQAHKLEVEAASSTSCQDDLLVQDVSCGAPFPKSELVSTTVPEPAPLSNAIAPKAHPNNLGGVGNFFGPGLHQAPNRNGSQHSAWSVDTSNSTTPAEKANFSSYGKTDHVKIPGVIGKDDGLTVPVSAVSMTSQDEADQEQFLQDAGQKISAVTAMAAGLLLSGHASSQTMMEVYFHAWRSLVQHLHGYQNFRCRDVWQHELERTNSMRIQEAIRRKKDYARNALKNEAGQLNQASETTARTPRTFILNPRGEIRVGYDLFGMILLLYDITMIPLESFDLGEPFWFVFMDWFTMIFWTFDMFMTCMTGYVHKGNTIMNPRRIITHYLKSWFALDLIVVCPDWIVLLANLGDQYEDASGSSKLLRALRTMRVIRLLRLMKLQRFLNMLKDQIDSETVFILVTVLKLLLLLFALNHFLGSTFFAIGTLSRSNGLPSWITFYRITERTFWFKYGTALHWSLTQFTPASIELQPQNEYERFYSIFVLVIGLVIFSSFVSSITSSMAQLRTMSEDKSKQFWLLRRYLRQRRIDSNLSFRILRYVEYACQANSSSVPEAKVWVLKLLSAQLRDELQYQVSFSCLLQHPFFLRASLIATATMNRLAGQALSTIQLAAGDTRFTSGIPATEMITVSCGTLQYAKIGEEAEALLGRCTVVDKGSWICEAVLWTEWFHLGSLQATSEVSLVAVDRKAFEEAFSRDPLAHSMANEYAEAFVAWLNKTPRNMLSDVHAQDVMKPEVLKFLDSCDYCELDPPGMANLFPRPRSSRTVPKDQLQQLQQHHGSISEPVSS
eukprot:TRINITY_DN20989_c0_g1_i1.p1 TRINITY_DN20989_c0_g1~~TRINITY_DN20989_c0_g1_i1.p1  ORF type:complete len:918 (-),score=134.97 TRINITY_DN20989_c0_g1_i1:176-2929(-)